MFGDLTIAQKLVLALYDGPSFPANADNVEESKK